MDFNTELQQLLQENNILFFKEIEEQEYEYYTIVFHKKFGKYHTPTSHPILDTLPMQFVGKDGIITLDEFQFQMIKEMLQLEQANVVVRIIDENIN